MDDNKKSNRDISKRPITLIERVADNISVYLTAEINLKGSLILSGQDLGSGVKEYWGDSDYEYWTIISRDQKLSVLLLLINKAFPNLMDLESWMKSVDVQYILEVSINGEMDFIAEADQEQIFIIEKSGVEKTDSKYPAITIKRNDDDKMLLFLLQNVFKRGIFKNDSEFMDWLKSNSIEYEFFSYA